MTPKPASRPAHRRPLISSITRRRTSAPTALQPRARISANPSVVSDEQGQGNTSGAIDATASVQGHLSDKIGSSDPADSNTTQGTNVSCTSCDKLRERIYEQDREISRLNTLFNEAKGRLEREESLVNQLTESNKKSSQSIAALEQRNAAISARLRALEQVLPTTNSPKYSRRRRNASAVNQEKPFSKMRKGELMVNVKFVAEKYHALCLAVRECAADASFDEITESSVESIDGICDATRVHDWTGRFHTIDSPPADIPLGNPPIRPTNDTSCGSVPICPLELVSNGYFTPRGAFPDCVIENALWKVVNAQDEFARFKDGAQWTESLEALKCDPATRSYVSRISNSALSNNNREAKVHFFSSLGYDLFNSKSSLSAEEQENEKKSIRLLLGTPLGGDDVDIKTIDAAFWRVKSWRELFNPARECPEEPPLEDIKSTGVDVLFNNNAARSAYLCFLNYIPGDSETVMSLARADAWITACTVLLSLPDGKGGKRNSQFRDLFTRLLPHCVSRLLGAFHHIILRESPGDLMKKRASTFQPTLQNPTLAHYELQIDGRHLTDVVYMPTDGEHYVYVKRSAFNDHICHWIAFADAYIARASDKDTMFNAIGIFDDLSCIVNSESSPTTTPSIFRKRVVVEEPPSSPKRQRIEEGTDGNVFANDTIGDGSNDECEPLDNEGSEGHDADDNTAGYSTIQ